MIINIINNINSPQPKEQGNGSANAFPTLFSFSCRFCLYCVVELCLINLIRGGGGRLH